MRKLLYSSLCLCLVLSATSVSAQSFKNLFSVDPADTLLESPEATVSAVLFGSDSPTQATIQVTLEIPAGSNTYSQQSDLAPGGKTTEIRVDVPESWKAQSPNFEPDHPPKQAFDELFQQEVGKFTGMVVFTQHYEIPLGTELSETAIAGNVELLICDSETCKPQRSDFQVRYREPEKREQQPAESDTAESDDAVPLTDEEVLRPLRDALPSAQAKDENPLNYAYEITPARGSSSDSIEPVRLQFELSPADAPEGELVTLAITMTIADNWHSFALHPADDSQLERPTQIKVSPTNLKPVNELTADQEPVAHVTEIDGTKYRANIHEKQVTWVQKFRVEHDGEYGLSGSVTYQVCEEKKTCLPPLQIPFSLGAARSESPTQSENAMPVVRSQVPTDPDSLKSGLATESVSTDMSFVSALIAAFGIGLVMNIMPCVLPVLAIKILSFVQQAGESRKKVIALNMAYTAGVMSVFLVLGFVVWGLGKSMSSLFQNQVFMSSMAAVIFLMGLSLFGVFELPVPGLIASAHHHQEGYLGAFNTGIVATIIGTPCIGPLVAGMLPFALRQPAHIVFPIFATMGVGMAFPYALTGFFPRLVNWLPKPGNWMVTFKQIMGFPMMATAGFLLYSIDMAYRVPMLFILLGLGMMAFVATKVASPIEPFSKHVKAYAIATLAALPLFLYGGWTMYYFPPEGFGGAHATLAWKSEEGNGTAAHRLAASSEGQSDDASKPLHQLSWEQFTGDRLIELRKAGRPMLVDFTANWCINCKLNEFRALNTKATVDFVSQNGVVPLLADFTNESADIREWLNLFGQDSPPLTVIIPPGTDRKPIPLRGVYSQKELLAALESAFEGHVASEPSAPAAVAAREEPRADSAQ